MAVNVLSDGNCQCGLFAVLTVFTVFAILAVLTVLTVFAILAVFTVAKGDGTSVIEGYRITAIGILDDIGDIVTVLYG